MEIQAGDLIRPYFNKNVADLILGNISEHTAPVYFTMNSRRYPDDPIFMEGCSPDDIANPPLTNILEATYKGTCSSLSPCQGGETHCHNLDSGCAGDLKCCERIAGKSSEETCNGIKSALSQSYDICYDPDV